MSVRRRSFSRRNSAAGSADDGSDEGDCGYVKVFLKPLERGNYSVILGWFGIRTDGWAQIPDRLLGTYSGQWLGLVYGGMALVAAFLLYEMVTLDLGYLFQRICGIVEPIFTIMCAFYWLALYLRRTWSSTSIYVLFCSCFAGEVLGQCLSTRSEDGYVSQPFVALVVLVAVAVASLFSTLETSDSVLVIGFVSLLRFMACSSLNDLPQITRPFLAYLSGILGTIGAKYMETTFRPPVNGQSNPEGKIPIIKRRRSSSSTAHSFTSHRAGRRTSLPALIQKSQVCVTGRCYWPKTQILYTFKSNQV